MFIGFQGRKIKSSPPERLAGVDDLIEAFSFALTEANALLHAEIGAHDFKHGETAAATHSGHESLADDPAQHVGHACADLFLFLGFEHTKDTIDSLSGIDGVNGAEDQVARFRCAQGNSDGVTIAHFTDENHFGRLPQRRAQAVGKAVKIRSQFALIESGQFMRMDEFDGILESNDVDGPGAVNLIEDRSQSGRFAGASRASDEHQARFFLGNLFDDLRKVQPIQGGNDGV